MTAQPEDASPVVSMRDYLLETYSEAREIDVRIHMALDVIRDRLMGLYFGAPSPEARARRDEWRKLADVGETPSDVLTPEEFEARFGAGSRS